MGSSTRSSSSSSIAVSLLILSAVGLLPLLAHSNGGFSMELIHRDSPKSPFYDPTSTPYSRLKAAAERSRSRAIYFQKAIQANTPSNSSSPTPAAADDFYSEITPNNFEYLMSIYLGSPAKKSLAIADTGSDLIWIQCKPCDQCYRQTAPLFDPKSSSTYKIVSCNSDSCSALPQGSCGSESQCAYNYAYGDGSYVDGYLSTETISFNTIGGRQVQFPKSFFGCTHRSNGTFDEKGAGLVGLGGGQLSLIRQLGSAIDSKFSYCLPSAEQTSAKSRLNFGSNAVVPVGSNGAVTTPLLPGYPDTFYFLSLEKISVAGAGAVDVKPASSMNAKPNDVQGNIIIDSGTTLTLIDDETLQDVTSKVVSIVKLRQVEDPSGVFSLCFDVSGKGKTATFPDITFHFSGGAAVVLHESNAFVESATNVLCLALISSDGIGVNIFGNIAQQNFHVEYDLDAMKLTLAPADCANL
ncbi:aspartic proteinase CDR1-like [Phalaenopsis equestris]|uniref:aspartic proteinase CDR1-like n=1 Tax=Phalaenopsis equestris TaxID=78828 RepID=UPI0009E1FF76|nr:aspartic proteinase CDR1-like [Phalaenopsis equestris]